MRRPLAAALCAVVLVVAVVSCTGDRATSPRDPSGRPSLSEHESYIRSQIDALFPDGPLNSEAHARHDAIRRYLGSENVAAAGQAVGEFIEWMQGLEQEGALLDPNGYYEAPTTHQAVGRLSSSLLSLVYGESAPPEDLFDRDGAIIVVGAGGGTITAPSQHAAGQFPAGALEPGSVVTLYRIPQDEPGKGPLPHSGPQYGPFFEFEVFPDQHVQQDVIVAICQVTDPSSPFYAPEEVHDALRLAKPRHDAPSELVVLDRVDPGTLVDCTDVQPGFAALDLPPSSRGEAALRFAARVAGRALSVFAPTPAHAVHLGLGGRVAVASGEGFSPFGAIVPADANQNPVASVGGPYTGRTEGRSFTYDGSGSTDPDGDPLTFSWDFGDGVSGVPGAMPTHRYADNGTYTVKVTVTDGRGGVSTDETLVTVANVAPAVRTVKLNWPTLNAPKAGQSWDVSWVWTDPGVDDDPWTWTVHWGDGTTTTGTRATIGEVATSHTYATPGTRNVTFRIVDKDGAAGARSIAVFVQP